MKQLSNSFKALIPILMIIFAILACVPPQDCMGVTFGVSGYIVDESDNPIPNAKIRAWNDGSFEKPAFDHNTVSNEDGSFSTGSAFSFGCTSFQVEVFAEGYELQTLTFYLPANEGWANELPAILTIKLEQ